MKKLILSSLFLALTTFVFAQKGKWVKLFDGKTTTGWHSWKSSEVKGWHIMDGALMTHGGNGDLVSDKEYGDFILEFDFKVAPKGNSGIIYKVIENDDKAFFATYASGPEYQIIDDTGYPQEVTGVHKTGSNYDIIAPSLFTAVKPAGNWNKGKIVIKNGVVQHFINGKLVVEYTYGSDEWKDQVANSKFAKWPYATAHAKGKIALQDHGDMVSFKNIRIKEL